MSGEVSKGGRGLLSGVTVLMAFAVATVVAIAWIVTWATSDLAMGLLGMGGAGGLGPLEAALFFAIMVVMMVAMMLPAALPMIVAFRDMTRLEGGRPVRPADLVATGLFVGPYFLVWGAFGALALLGLIILGAIGRLPGLWALLPAATLIVAGAYQVTRVKEVCLTHCQSPMGFVMLHWRPGRTGALRMGLRHAAYCLGCCWLFMIVLFVAGSMSLLWMGGLSLAIFVEKAGPRTSAVPRAIGGILVALGLIAGLRALGLV